MYASGLLISWATPAESIPSDASFSDWTTRAAHLMTLDELTDLSSPSCPSFQGDPGSVGRGRKAKNSSTPRHSPRRRIGTAKAVWNPSAWRPTDGSKARIRRDVGNPFRLGTIPDSTRKTDPALHHHLIDSSPREPMPARRAVARPPRSAVAGPVNRLSRMLPGPSRDTRRSSGESSEWIRRASRPRPERGSSHIARPVFAPPSSAA